MPTPFKYELLDLSNTHNAIADWLIANPGKGQLGKCAAVFGYTRSWLSTLIHQDAFQALLKHKQGAAFEQVVIPLHDKMAGVAHRGVEKLGEIMETTNDERLVREVTKDMLNGLGYGANAKGPGGTIINNTQNNLIVDSNALAKARALRSQHFGSKQLESTGEPKVPALEGEASRVPASEELGMGEARDIRALDANSEEAASGITPEGNDLRGSGAVAPE